MRVIVAVISTLLIAIALSEFFFAFLVPRRVKRGAFVGRGVFVMVWRPWRALAGRLPARAADTMLGIFGPVGLIVLVASWAAMLVAGFTGFAWGTHAALVEHGATRLADDLYFSTASFFNVSSALSPRDLAGKIVRIAEAASGYAVLFVVIGYLPALFQAYSRREVAVSLLDARAGSPPSVSRLVGRAGNLGGWQQLDRYLAEWETWAAELMETHLSYPILAYYRSQHINQNWLGALVCVMDAAAFAIAAAPARTPSAELTFAIGRHALADLAHTFRGNHDIPALVPRLDDAAFERLVELASELELELNPGDAARSRLDELCAMYEPYATTLSRTLALPLPLWIGENENENWRLAAWRSRRAGGIH